MYDPYNNDRRKPAFTDWMAGVQSLLPPIDFHIATDSGQHNRGPDIGDVDLSPDDLQPFPDLTDEECSNSLPVLCDDTFDYLFLFDQDAHGSDTSHTVSSLTEILQSPTTTNTRTDNHECESPRAKSINTAGTKDTQDLRCWDHGCNGQLFTTLSNLKRHQREKSSQRPSYPCTMCGAIFSRSTARNHHIQNQSCGRIRRHSNGRQRPNRISR